MKQIQAQKAASSNPPAVQEGYKVKLAQYLRLLKVTAILIVGALPTVAIAGSICTPFTYTLVAVSASPDLGTLKPDVLVSLNTRVQLAGIASTVTVRTDCIPIFLPINDFTWSLSHQIPGSAPMPSDVLDASDTLTPTFVANKRGVYRAGLSAGGTTYEAVIVAEDISPRGTWISIGPDNIGGRTSAIAIGRNVIYAGADFGGIWKSEDHGASWLQISDNKLPRQDIRALALAFHHPVDPPKIFAGTAGGGIFESSDGGNSWRHSGSDLSLCNNTQLGSANVRKIVIHRQGAVVFTIYAATDRGIFRANLSGNCWTQLFGTGNVSDLDITVTSPPTVYAAVPGVGLYRAKEPITDPTRDWTLLTGSSKSGDLLPSSGFGWVVIAVSKSAPETLYAGFEPGDSYQVFKSTDGGDTWSKRSTAPQTCWGQCDDGTDNFIAVDPADSNIVYVGQVHLHASKNGGVDWTDLTCPQVSGGNACELRLSKSKVYLHDDQQTMAFDPDNPKTVYIGNHGGVWRSEVPIVFTEPPLEWSKWISLNNGYATTLFYDISVNPQVPFDVAGGLYDNNNLYRVKGSSWSVVPGSGGDGFRTAFDTSSALNNRIIYHDAYWGNGIARWNEKKKKTDSLGSRGNFFADPYRPGVLLKISSDMDTSDSKNPKRDLGITGQLFASANTDIDTAIWQCIDPTPTNVNDNVTAVAFVRPDSITSLPSYYVGTDNGSIYQVTIAGDPPKQICNRDAISHLQLERVYQHPNPSSSPACNQPDNTVQGISIDPDDPEVLYATFRGCGANRVMRFTKDGSGLLNGQGIAGTHDPLNPESGGLPDSLQVGDVAVDPFDTNGIKGVYASTFYGGLWRGEFDGRNRRWNWSRASVLPSVDTNADGSGNNSNPASLPGYDTTPLEMYVSPDGITRILRVGTFGRGVWELVRSAPTAMPILVEDQISECQVQEFSDLESRDRALQIKVDYAYLSEHGDNVQIRPVIMQENQDSPYFVRQSQQIQHGQGSADLLILYAAESAPLSLNTDAIRIEFFTPDQAAFFSKVCTVPRTWKKLGTRTLSVSAIAQVDDGTSPITVPITIDTADGKTNQNTAFDLVLNQGVQVIIEAPAEFKQEKEVWSFAGWRISNDQAEDQRSLSVRLDNDIPLVAYYVLGEQPTERATLELEAICEDCATGPTSIEVPVELAYNSGKQTVKTPFASSYRRGLPLRVQASAETLLGDRTLVFTNWVINGRSQPLSEVFLAMDADKTLLARYRIKQVSEGPLTTKTTATANQVCNPNFSHELNVNWKVTGGKPPISVTIEITGPDGSQQTVGVEELEGSRTFNLAYPGGGSVSVKVVAKDASNSSSSAQSSVQLGKCS